MLIAPPTFSSVVCSFATWASSCNDRIVAEAKALGEIGIGTIAIMPNDTATYREDSFNNMKAFAAIRAAFQGQALRALMGSISKSGAMSGGLLEVNRNQPS
jgi:hypothetical protein